MYRLLCICVMVIWLAVRGGVVLAQTQPPDLTVTPDPKVKSPASSAKTGPASLAHGLRSQHPDCRASLPEAWKAAPALPRKAVPTGLTRAGPVDPEAAVVSPPEPARGPRTGRPPCMQEVDSWFAPLH